jgi:hypothetical protein
LDKEPPLWVEDGGDEESPVSDKGSPLLVEDQGGDEKCPISWTGGRWQPELTLVNLPILKTEIIMAARLSSGAIHAWGYIEDEKFPV